MIPLLRALCVLGKHKPVRVIDRFEALHGGPALGYRVLGHHHECVRCGRTL